MIMEVDVPNVEKIEISKALVNTENVYIESISMESSFIIDSKPLKLVFDSIAHL